MARKPTALVSFTLRLREDLRRRLERAADKADRSLNIEIVERLEASFAAEDKAREQKQMMAKLEETAASMRVGFADLTQWLQDYVRRQKEGQ